MKKTKPLLVPLLLAPLMAAALGGCAWMRPDRAVRVVTGTTAHDLCSETFVSGQDPERTFNESLKPRPGYHWVAGLVHYDVDRERREVQARFAGGFSSRAVYGGRDGCRLVQGAATGAPAPLTDPATVSEAPALPRAQPSAALESALDQAFAENVPGAARNTKAVVVWSHGRIVAERYADGYDRATPVLGFSMSKSVTSALAGLMVGDGRLRADTPALGPGGDPAISLEQALRMTTGLALDETGSGFDPANQMLYVHTDDMAAFARAAKPVAAPGQRWFYSTASTHLVARLLRDAAGGAQQIQRYARERLFAPLGMRHVTLETDGSGTAVGGHYTLASAQDWLRLGLLYLHDGRTLDGQRLLPEGWVQWSTQPTLGTDYGAGWWINHRAPGATDSGADMPLLPHVPADAFYALGNLGQYIVVVPSHDLVVVRLGRAHTPYLDQAGIDRLVADCIAASG